MRAAAVVLGGGLPQGPLICRLQERGHDVCVVDGRTDRPSLALANVAIHQDFSQISATVSKVAAALVRPTAVLTMASDQAVVPAARLAEVWGLPSLSVEAALAASDKAIQRARWEEAGIPSARFRVVRTVEEAERAFAEIGPEVVIKPTDGAAQRGVSEVRSRTDVAKAVAHAIPAGRSGELIVEDYLDGDEYTVNGWVIDRRFVPVTVTLRALAPPPAVGICTAHRYPSGRSVDDDAAMVDAVGRAALALGIDGAPIYAQVRFGRRGPRLIELGARLGGGGDAALALLVTGVDMVDAMIDAAFGRLVTLPRREPVDACGQVAFVIPGAGKVVRAAAGQALSLPGIHEVGFYHPPGRIVPPLVSASGRLGYITVTAPTPEELDARTATAMAALDVLVEPV